MSPFQGVGIETLYTEVSSFQGFEIEKFHFIERFPHFSKANRDVSLEGFL